MQPRCLAAIAAIALLPLGPAAAQQPTYTPYADALTLEQAKKGMAAAEEVALKNGWPVAIAVLDVGGRLVLFEKIDNTQPASIEIAQGKARTALEFRRPTKALEDAIAAGGAGLRLTALKGHTPLEGGVLIVKDGKIIGAVGASGVLSSQDVQVAQAGADAIAK